jgi:hypothetical protein
MKIQAVGRRCHDIGKQIIVHTDDISKITKDLKELKDRVDQQPPAPVSKDSDGPSSVPSSVPAAVSPSAAAAVSPSVAAAVSPSVAAVVPPIASAKSPPPPAVQSVPAQTGRLDSLIVSEYPPLFEEFRMKRWTVLWRGSRDGFTAQEFHRRCDGHANTLTLILDTDGNVFGGFTPVEWESSSPRQEYGYTTGDDSLRSFLFTLRNPHGVPPRKFALKKERKESAIYCYSRCCAGFGYYNYYGCEIRVSNNCNNRNNYTHIGTRWGSNTTYANDTQFGDFFTGAELFTVKEIEVFEIED